MAIHGGAGNFTLESIGDRAQEMRTAMAMALAAGHRILSAGGSSLDAVEAAVVVLEDSPQFNAGKGAVFTHEGTNELDAAIMDGRTRMAGAVAGVKRVKNPIRLARLVMEQSPHVLMVGEGAEAFAKERGGIEFVPESISARTFDGSSSCAPSRRRRQSRGRFCVRATIHSRAPTSGQSAPSRSTRQGISPRPHLPAV